jgi:hypothetical protein
MGEVTIDFVAFDDERNACLMVLVEQPWSGPDEAHLRALQDRLYGCLDAALDGQLADQFPNSRGRDLIIRIDCYDLARDRLDDFVARFSEGIAALPDYSATESPYVNGIRFEVKHNTLGPTT